jgi:type 1 glutamine amidotransferase
LAAADGFAVEHTEDPAVFTSARLSHYAAVVLLHTTGDMLDSAAVDALAAYVREGGGLLAIHAAADALYGSATYRDLVGALFLRHPALQTGVIVVEDAASPATTPLPPRWQHVDEFYDFSSNPRGTVRVLLRLDEASYQGGAMGADHPIAWCHRVGRGRAFYTGLGHPIASWSEPLFIAHIRGALRIAAGRVSADCTAN